MFLLTGCVYGHSEGNKKTFPSMDESLLEDEIDDYHPVYSSNCEKVTSITGSKSNRFNLIQSLCEAFECWAKLTIEHNEKGQN